MSTMLEILTSPALGAVKHGFFTRKGGASSGIFAGLNCGPGSSDQSEAVRTNRARAADALGVELNALQGVNQVHSPDVAVIEEITDPPPRADAAVTKVPGIAISILTADCQPVLFSDPKAGVIGAAHAGWRGAMEGVLENTLDAMERLGAHREDITAVIGPCISVHSYEVGEDFMEQFLMEDMDYSRFFSPGPSGKPHFDLPSFSLHRLREAGVGEAEWMRRCTYREPERFYSYRRATHAGEADYGRLLSAIRL